MSPGQDDGLLCNAVKTMMAKIFRSGMVFNCELSIEGTIGVTVDNQKVVVFHFDEKVSQNDSASQMEQSTFEDNIEGSRVSGCETLPSCFPSGSWLGLGGFRDSGMASDTNAGRCKSNYLESSKMMRCFQDTTVSNRQMFNPTLNESIAIESSDSDTFDSIQLEDAEMTVETSESKMFGKSLAHSSTDTKIAIKTRGLFDSDRTLRRGMPSVDCDSIPDPTESRSLFSDFSPRARCDEIDTKNGFSRSDGKLVCEICGHLVSSVCQLEAHLVSKHGIVESTQLGKITHFLCQVCRKRYRFQAQLDKHMLRHDADRPFQCKLCRNAYRCKESLVLHVQVHDDDLKCGLCMKSYTSKVLFQKHIAYMHEKVKDGRVQRYRKNFEEVDF